MKKVKNTLFKITIIGSGFVGKATGKGFLKHGYDVSFVDVNNLTIDSLTKEGLLSCNIEAKCVSNSDIYFISVLTPTIDEHFEYRFIDSALASLGQVIKNETKKPIVVIRSTVLPGTTEERFSKIIEQYSQKKLGEDFYMAMNPEFLREIHAESDFAKPWIIVIGSNEAHAAQILDDLYKPFNAPIVHMTIKEAEMLKYVHNIYNANKISFFNEMRMVAEKVGVDADKIFQTVIKSAEASWNPEYGTKNFGPYGGSCLPKDTQAFLDWANNHHKQKMHLLHSVIKVNDDLKNRKYLGF